MTFREAPEISLFFSLFIFVALCGASLPEVQEVREVQATLFTPSAASHSR